MRQRGEDVFFLTGTDEHGEPVELAAEREGITPQELADRNAEKFRELMPIIDATNDFFIRTSDPRHTERVAEVMQRVYDNGWVTKGIYEGWYCPRCADFKTERELGPGNTCPIHEIALEKVTRGELVLQALGLPGAARSPLRGAARLRRPRLPPQRGGRLHQAGPRRRLALAPDPEVGDGAALGPEPAHVRLVRRAAQLLHGPRLRPRGRGPDRPLLAGDAAPDRQGHPQVPRRDLAGAADGRRARAAAADDDPRLPPDGREKDVEEPRQRPRPVRGDRALRRRRAALLPLPRGQLRPGRLDLDRRLRVPLRDRARQRLRQPGQPGAGDGRPLPGRRRPRGGGRRGPRRGLRGRGAALLRAARPRRAEPGAGGGLDAGAAPQPLRRGDQAVGAGQGRGRSRAARRGPLQPGRGPAG